MKCPTNICQQLSRVLLQDFTTQNLTSLGPWARLIYKGSWKIGRNLLTTKIEMSAHVYSILHPTDFFSDMIFVMEDYHEIKKILIRFSWGYHKISGLNWKISDIKETSIFSDFLDSHYRKRFHCTTLIRVSP